MSTPATTGEFEFDRQRHLRRFADRLADEVEQFLRTVEQDESQFADLVSESPEICSDPTHTAVSPNGRPERKPRPPPIAGMMTFRWNPPWIPSAFGSLSTRS